MINNFSKSYKFIIGFISILYDLVYFKVSDQTNSFQSIISNNFINKYSMVCKKNNIRKKQVCMKSSIIILPIFNVLIDTAFSRY